MPHGKKGEHMEHIKDILPRVRKKLLEKCADMYAWDKYVEYLSNLHDDYEDIDYSQDPAEQEAALEVYKEAYQYYIDKYSLENN